MDEGSGMYQTLNYWHIFPGQSYLPSFSFCFQSGKVPIVTFFLSSRVRFFLFIRKWDKFIEGIGNRNDEL